jgi:hypothetical protein
LNSVVPPHHAARRPIPPKPDRDKGQSHQAAVASGLRIGRSGSRIPTPLPARQSLTGGYTDVEATAGAGILALLVPTNEAPHKVSFIEPIIRGQTVGQCKRHRRIVGPLPGLQSEWPAPHHVGKRWVAIARLELQAQADRKS